MKNSNRALKVLQSVQTLDGKESKSLQIDVVWGKKYEYIEHVLKKKKRQEQNRISQTGQKTVHPKIHQQKHSICS